MTSLAQQLKRLAVPQTQVLLGSDKRRASFLYDAKDAASFDRQFFFCKGQNGLAALGVEFEEFEASLFGQSAGFERSIQTREVNEQLDKELDLFLIRLSPYLPLKSAQEALEWVIYRYRVHLNNVDSLMRCFLPYHHTDLFPRILQLIMLDAENKWEWLMPMKKNAIPLPPLTLVNRCAVDTSMISFISDMVQGFLKAYGENARDRTQRLCQVLNLFSWTVMAVLDRGVASEAVVLSILPMLLKGLKSSFVPFRSAAYGILLKLMYKTPLDSKLLERIANSLCKNLPPMMGRECISLFVFLFQTQPKAVLSERAFNNVIQNTSLVSILEELSSKFQTSNFVTAFMHHLVPSALQQSVLDDANCLGCLGSSGQPEADSSLQMTVLHDTFTMVSMNTGTLELSIRLLVTKYIEVYKNFDENKHSVQQVKRILAFLENRHSALLIKIVDNIMTATRSAKEKDAMKHLLNMALSSVHQFTPDSDMALSLRLYHPEPTVRQLAVSFLLDNISSMQDEQFLKAVLLARIEDENPAVVLTVLKDAEKLKTIFENGDELTDVLLKKLCSVDTGLEKVPMVNEILRSFSLCASTPTLEAVAVSHLLLLSGEADTLQNVTILLSSPLSESSSFLSEISKSWLPHVKSVAARCTEAAMTSAEQAWLNSSLMDSLLTSAECCDTSQVLQSFLEQIGTLSIFRQRILAYLLCEVGIRFSQSADCEAGFDLTNLILVKMINQFLFSEHLVNLNLPCSCRNSDNEMSAWTGMEHKLHATWYLNLLSRWINSLHFPKTLSEVCFWQECCTADEVLWLQALVSTVNILFHLRAKGLYEEMVSSCFSQLEKVFGSVEMYCRFLTLLWSGRHCPGLGVTDFLLDRSMELSMSYLEAMSVDDAALIVQDAVPVLPCILMLIVNSNEHIRHCCIKMSKELHIKCSGITRLFTPVLELLCQYQQEINADSTYFVTVMVKHQWRLLQKSQNNEHSCLTKLLQVVEMDSTPPFIAAALLDILGSLDNIDVLLPLLPLMERLLMLHSLDIHRQNMLRSVLALYTPIVSRSLASKCKALSLLMTAMKSTVLLSHNTSVQSLAITRITKNFFICLPDLDSQRVVMRGVLDTLVTTDSPSVACNIRKFFKHVPLSSSILAHEMMQILDKSANFSTVKSATKRPRLDSLSVAGRPTVTKVWTRVTLLLEILQSKKKILDKEKLLPLCFDILDKTQDMSDGEYVKQLLLGFIHNICSSVTGDIGNGDLCLDSVVNCIQSSSNRQTHQQALLVLSAVAKIAPEQLLHSMMRVFTFVGGTILRQDDNYSLQVITRILETVFPAMVIACGGNSEDMVRRVTAVLRVFVDAYPHIPVHRKLMIFTTLLRVVGTDEHLWRLLLTFIDSVVVRSVAGVSNFTFDVTGNPADRKSKIIEETHLNFFLSLVLEFPPALCLKMADKVLQYLHNLPLNVEDFRQITSVASKSTTFRNVEECDIASLHSCSRKQLHKFKHATIFMLSHIFSDHRFVIKISDGLCEEILQCIQKLLQTVLAYTCQTSDAVRHFSSTPNGEYWKGLLNKCSIFLSGLVSLLPAKQHLVVVSGLLDSPLSFIKCKAMDILISRIQHVSSQELDDLKPTLLEIVEKMRQSICRLSEDNNDVSKETFTTGKTAMFTMMLLCRWFGDQQHVTFQQVLGQVCEVLANGRIGSDVVSMAMMCAADIVSHIHAYAINYIPDIVPSILQHLQDTNIYEIYMLSSCVVSLRQIVSTLCNFLSPYLTDIIAQVCFVRTMIGSHPHTESRERVLKNLNLIVQSLSMLSSRVLLQAIPDCYTKLLNSGRQECIQDLLHLLTEHVSHREDPHELVDNQSLLQEFFLIALDFRVVQSQAVSKSVIDRVEGSLVETVSSMMLKMIEAHFRAMLVKMFEWATETDASRDRLVTFYRLADSLAGRLKNLFLEFAAYFFQHAVELLDKLNSSKSPGKRYLKKDKSCHKACQLLEYTLSCLQKICLYDTQGFIDKRKFYLLMNPLLDQIGNFIGGNDSYQNRILNFLAPTVADFLSAAKNDSLWKDLSHNLMDKSKTDKVEVKLSVLHVLRAIVKKLGEDYLPSLNEEVVPMLYELMEDDHEEVEKLVHVVLEDVETILGEPLPDFRH